jgi:SAM-dependent methyltransferase
VSERVDFSGNASVYDLRHGAFLSDEGLKRLRDAAGLHDRARVLDIGAGTGRVAIPLAKHGCHVVAVEPSMEMLAHLRDKATSTDVLGVVAEGARLPFPARQFDAVVVARLLYLTPDWRAIIDEACQVVAAGGRLLHEWGNGHADEEWVQIRDEARRLFEQEGRKASFHPGARSEAEVGRQIVSLGFIREAHLVLGSGPLVTLREFLRRLVSGELSYIWSVPSDVQAACLPRLQQWAAQKFDLERPVPMPRQLGWTVYRKDER